MRFAVTLSFEEFKFENLNQIQYIIYHIAHTKYFWHFLKWLHDRKRSIDTLFRMPYKDEVALYTSLLQINKPPQLIPSQTLSFMVSNVARRVKYISAVQLRPWNNGWSRMQKVLRDTMQANVHLGVAQFKFWTVIITLYFRSSHTLVIQKPNCAYARGTYRSNTRTALEICVSMCVLPVHTHVLVVG